LENDDRGNGEGGDLPDLTVHWSPPFKLVHSDLVRKLACMSVVAGTVDMSPFGLIPQ
jgi:hypothetical protein